MATPSDTDTVKIRLDSMAAERGRGMEGAIRAAIVVQEDKGEKDPRNHHSYLGTWSQ